MQSDFSTYHTCQYSIGTACFYSRWKHWPLLPQPRSHEPTATISGKKQIIRHNNTFEWSTHKQTVIWDEGQFCHYLPHDGITFVCVCPVIDFLPTKRPIRVKFCTVVSHLISWHTFVSQQCLQWPSMTSLKFHRPMKALARQSWNK